jgi:hypothetical protein
MLLVLLLVTVLLDILLLAVYVGPFARLVWLFLLLLLDDQSAQVPVCIPNSLLTCWYR